MQIWMWMPPSDCALSGRESHDEIIFLREAVRAQVNKPNAMQCCICFFLSRLAARKERLYLSLCDVVRLSVCLSAPPPNFVSPKIFLVKQGATQCYQVFLVFLNIQGGNTVFCVKCKRSWNFCVDAFKKLQCIVVAVHMATPFGKVFFPRLREVTQRNSEFHFTTANVCLSMRMDFVKNFVSKWTWTLLWKKTQNVASDAENDSWVCPEARTQICNQEILILTITDISKLKTSNSKEIWSVECGLFPVFTSRTFPQRSHTLARSTLRDTGKHRIVQIWSRTFAVLCHHAGTSQCCRIRCMETELACSLFWQPLIFLKKEKFFSQRWRCSYRWCAICDVQLVHVIVVVNIVES